MVERYLPFTKVCNIKCSEALMLECHCCSSRFLDDIHLLVRHVDASLHTASLFSTFLVNFD